MQCSYIYIYIQFAQKQRISTDRWPDGKKDRHLLQFYDLAVKQMLSYKPVNRYIFVNIVHVSINNKVQCNCTYNWATLTFLYLQKLTEFDLVINNHVIFLTFYTKF